MQMKRRTLLQGATSAIGLSLAGLAPQMLFAQEADGVLRVAIAKAAGDLDLLKHYAIWAVQDLMFEPLVKYGSGGVMEPCLATDWTLSDDGLRLDLNLREGVTFQDGTAFDAESAKWNLDRWLGTEKFSWMNSSRLYVGTEITGPHAIAISFKEPVVGLMQELSYTRPSRFVSPKAIGADGAQLEPVGTGPWRQISADDTQSVFERYDGYWGEKPTFKGLEAKVIPDARARVAALRSGEIDLTGGFWIAPLTPVEAKQLDEAGVPVAVDPGNVTLVLAYNPDRSAAIADLNVRRAISIGIDRNSIAQAIYLGYARPAGSLFSAALPLSGTQFDPPARDPAAAAAMLEQSGWTGSPIRQKDGQPLTVEMVVSPDAVPGSRLMAEVMQAQLREVGIDMVIRSVDHASKHTDMLDRNYDLGFFLTYGAPFEPFGTIVGLFLSTFANDVEGKIVTDATNLDPLINGAMAAKPADAEAEIQKFYDWLRDNEACSPILYVPSIWAHSPRLTGFVSPVTEYDMPYENITFTS